MKKKVFGAIGVLLATLAFAWFQFGVAKYKAFKIPAGSMIPTPQVSLAITSPRRSQRDDPCSAGDVVVFRYPKDPDKDFVKRVVAVGGDTLEMHDHVLSINGKPIPTRKLDEPCTYEDFDETNDTWDTRQCVAVEEKLDGHTYKVLYNSGDTLVTWTCPVIDPAGHVLRPRRQSRQ